MSYDRLTKYFSDPDFEKTIERETLKRREFDKTDESKALLAEFIEEHGQDMLSESQCTLYPGIGHLFMPHGDSQVECYFCGVVYGRYER